ncbi:MAG: peptide chain release factor 2, partial [Actinomycetia bacterium]|nr:peptide chain release factor 2 [Actinomycetes bacterium]
MEDLSPQLERQSERLLAARAFLHIEEGQRQLAALEAQAAAPDFWSDPQRAAELNKQAAALRDDLADFAAASTLLEDARAANELALQAADEDLAAEAAAALAELIGRIDQLEMNSWFTGKFDAGDAIVSISPGQGGLEAQDWTAMLMNMYLSYAARRGFKVEVLDAPVAETIGLDHATFQVSGRHAYGLLHGEQGVHRLVRISPTDAKARRQTTFAGVEVLPVLPEDIEVVINPADLRIDVYHSSGPGGQSVNTTDSAVRITHLPSGLVVTCQDQKSQLQNKESALRILKSRLYELEQQRRQAEVDELRGPKVEAAWGNQIRSYVLFPYQLVKDLRTGVETGNVDA